MNEEIRNQPPPALAANRPGPRNGRSHDAPRLAVVLTGGGARGAYQVGVLKGLGRIFPDVRFRIVTGVSSGAINAAWLASYAAPLGPSAEKLAEHWKSLEVNRVFKSDVVCLARSFAGWVFRMAFGGTVLGRLRLGEHDIGPRVRGFLDTRPLRELLVDLVAYESEEGRLHDVAENVAAGHLDALALTTVNYGTGQTVTWVEGRDVVPWELPNRLSRHGELGVDHVMASAALPLLFPAVKLDHGDVDDAADEGWYGDGGIRLAAPLSPALHLGAERILAVSTRYDRTRAEAEAPTITGYPPPAVIAGNLLNAVFLDVLDQNARRLERVNQLLARLPEDERGGLREVDLALVRPSQDLGALSAEFEPRLPSAFRFFTRSFGTRDTKSPDFLSLLMFQSDYVGRLIEIGEHDALAQEDRLRELVEGSDAVPDGG